MARNNVGGAGAEYNNYARIREDQQEAIEAHVAGVCVRPKGNEWEVLIAKRTRERSLYPGKWECGGGQVRSGEGCLDAIKRQIFEEFSIEVEVFDFLETYKILVPSDGRIIPGIRFLCIAGEGRVRLNKREFSSHRWVRFPVPSQLDWIEGIKNVLDRIVPSLLATIPQRKPPDSTQQREIPVISRLVN